MILAVCSCLVRMGLSSGHRRYGRNLPIRLAPKWSTGSVPALGVGMCPPSFRPSGINFFVLRPLHARTNAQHELERLDGAHPPIEPKGKFVEVCLEVPRTHTAMHCIAPQCPWENDYAERFIRLLKESLQRKCLFTSEAALRLALVE